MDGAYNGTQGFVPTRTSVNRLTPRLETVADYILRRGVTGVTWHEVAEELGIHHGQASGALSNLHKLGEVFVRKGWERQKCQVYIHASFRPGFDDFMCVDEPVRTKNTQMMQAIIAAAEQVVADGGSPLSVFTLEQVLNKYKGEIK